jgi:uncharacterized membrane protein YecN with MAPEG domain
MNTLPLYAALLALIFVFLSVRTLRLRHTLKIGIGDGGNTDMLRAMRVHSNFSEYVPLSLILIFLVEAQGSQTWLVHALGLCLLVGRLSHAFGVSQTRENFTFRVAGMALTFTVLMTSAVYLLVRYVQQNVA